MRQQYFAGREGLRKFWIEPRNRGEDLATGRRCVVVRAWVCALCCALITPATLLATSPLTAEDVNGDGMVTGLDIAEVKYQLNWNRSVDEAANPRADVNADGQVSGLDIAAISMVMRCRDNEAPIAVAGEDQAVEAGQTVTLDASASFDPEDGDALRYRWTFDNGDVVQGVSVDRVFSAPGEYWVELVIEDSCGATDSDGQWVSVSPAGEVTADFNISPEPVKAGESATFTATAPDSQVYGYFWNFSDRSSGYGQAVTKTFTQIGMHSVTLTVIPLGGSPIVETRTFMVQPSLVLLGMADNQVSQAAQRLSVAADGVVWVTGQTASVATVDVSDPANPVVLDQASIHGYLLDIAISSNGQFAAVAADFGGLYLFDATQPADLTVISGYPVSIVASDGLGAKGVALHDGYAHVACGWSWRVYDTTQSSGPSLVANLPLPAYLDQPEIAGDYIYAIDHSTPGIAVIDATDPALPALVRTVPTLGVPQSLHVQGNYLSVAEGSAGFQVFDLSNPDDPAEEIRKAYSSGTVRGVARAGQHVYVANVSRIEKWRITGSNSLQMVGYQPLQYYAYDLRMSADEQPFLFSAVASNGVLAVLDP